MQTSSAIDSGVPLADYGRLLRRQGWLLLLVTILGGLLAAAYTATQPKLYESTSAVLVSPILINAADATKRPADLVNLDTESQLVRSVTVATGVKAALPSTKTAEELAGAVSITVPSNTQVMQITFTGSTAKEAQHGAQAFTDTYLKYRRDQAASGAKRQLAQLQKQSASISAQLLDVSGKIAGAAANSPDRAFLISKQQALTAQLTDTQGTISRLTNIDTEPGQVVQSAELPTQASSPSLPLNTAIGLAVGALVGLLLAMVRHRRDDRVRTAEDLQDRFGLPVLATIPVSGRPGVQLAALCTSGPALEAYRRLRAVLLGSFVEDTRRRREYLGTDVLPTARDTEWQITRDAERTPMLRDGERPRMSGRVLLFTAVGNGPDTAEAGANLAVLLARGGSSVVLIDARAGSPAVQALGLANDRGLSDVIEHEAYGDELVQRPGGIPNLAVIGTGQGTGPVSEVFSSRIGRQLLDWLQRSADYVIITTASVTRTADAQTLAPLAHAVVLSVPAGATRDREVRAAAAELTSVGTAFVGAVLLQRSSRSGAEPMRRGSAVASRREATGALSARTHG